MKWIYKYTLQLAVELVIKVLSALVSKDDKVIKS